MTDFCLCRHRYFTNWLHLLMTWLKHIVVGSHTKLWFISCSADHAMWHFLMRLLCQHMDTDPSSRSLLTWGRMFMSKYETGPFRPWSDRWTLYHESWHMPARERRRRRGAVVWWGVLLSEPAVEKIITNYSSTTITRWFALPRARQATNWHASPICVSFDHVDIHLHDSVQKNNIIPECVPWFVL
jgi:hypothetical protein